MAERDVGDGARLRGSFTDLSEVAADPTTVVFRMKEPDGTLTVYTSGVDVELVNDVVGGFYVDWTFTAEGEYYWRMEGTGAVIAAAEEYEHCRRSQIV